MRCDNRRHDEPGDYQLAVVAPCFRLGVRCDGREVFGVDFLLPGDEVAAANPLAAEVERQLDAYLRDPRYSFRLPLRPAGTPFQRRVWQQIAAIPAGQTRSYGDLAIDLQSAPRAVGQACGANPYPVVVPCHRVLARAGRLGGFAHHVEGFPLEVKRWLLAHERDDGRG